MNSNVYRKIMIATDGSELVKKAVDKAIELAKLTEAKLYAVNVIAYGEFPEAFPKDVGWENAMRERLRNEGKEATAYVEGIGNPQVLR